SGRGGMPVIVIVMGWAVMRLRPVAPGRTGLAGSMAGARLRVRAWPRGLGRINGRLRSGRPVFRRDRADQARDPVAESLRARSGRPVPLRRRADGGGGGGGG